MRVPSARSRRYVVLVGFFLVAFLLYPAAEAGSAGLEMLLLGLLVVLMAIAIWTG
jgi:hypothetical protein